MPTAESPLAKGKSKPFSDISLRSLKPKDKPYKLADSGGLFIVVSPAGGKHWKLAYRHAGKQKTLSFGEYPYVSLADARKKREDAKTVLAAGRDPAGKRKRVAPDRTFEFIAREWFNNRKGEWVEAHASRVLSRLEADVFPEFGDRELDDIKGMDVLEMVRKVEDRGAIDVSKRILQTCNQVFCYGIITDRGTRNPSGELRGALKKNPRVKHFAALKVPEIPEFLKRLDYSSGNPLIRLAVMFTLLTFVRTNETRYAVWSEFEGLDTDAPTWRIPKERMKMGREHIVPLSRQVVALLTEIKQHSGDCPYLFPSYGRSGVLSQNAMIQRVYDMGYRGLLTIHGFRGTASTVLNENDFASDHIERQLAHAEENEIRGAYNSAEWLPQRRVMMQWWADFIDGQRAATKSHN